MTLPNDIAPLTEGNWRPVVLGNSFVDDEGPYYRMELEAADEPLRFGFVIADRHCNGIGVCHGGMISTFLDFAFGFAGKAACRDDQPTPTISLSVDFLQPGLVGEWVESRSRLVHKTRRMFFIEGTLVTSKGPIARANAIFKRPSPPCL